MTGAAPPRSLVAFGVLSAAYFASLGLFNPYAPLWFQSLGMGTVAIGVIAALQSWTRVVAPYAWGWWADHGGGRIRLLRGATLAAALITLGLFLPGGAAWVALVTTLLFLANGAVVPLSESALAQRLTTGGQVDTGRYGRVRVWGSVGFIAAVTLGGLLLERFSVALFPWMACAGFAALALAARRLPAAVDEQHGHSAAAPGVLAVLRQPAVAWFFASVACTVLAHTALYAFLSIYLDALGYPKSAVGAMWAVAVAGEIAFFWFQGRWFHRLRAETWLGIAAAVAALRFALTAAWGAQALVLVVAQATHALTFAAHHAACVNLLSRHFPGPLRGRGQALYSTLGYGVPGVLGGLGGGLLIDQLGAASVFWAASLAALGGVACAWCSVRAPAHSGTVAN